MKRIILFLTLQLLLFCSLSAQEKAIIRGTVIDAKTKEGLLGVNVFLENTYIGTSTKEYGDFVLKKIPEGEYLLSVSFVGYEKSSRLVRVKAEGAQNYVFEIKELTNKIGEVVVKENINKSEIKEIAESPMSVSVIDGIKLRGRASGIDEILTRTSGVKIRKTGGVGSSYKISIHGLEGKQIAVFIDGFPLNSPDGSFDINDIPVDAIKRIEVYKGIIPAEFGGDGLGGAINVVTREDETDLVGFTQEVGSFGTIKTLVALKKMFNEQGIQLSVAGFYSKSNNNYEMTYPIYDTDLPKDMYRRVRRENDYYSAMLGTMSVVFTKLWFDKIEIECPFYKNEKGIQALNFNSQSAYTHGTSFMPCFSFEKENFFLENLDFKFSGVVPIINTHLVDTTKTITQWDGNVSNSQGETGDLIFNNSDDKQREVRLRTNLKYEFNSQNRINLNNQFAYSNYKPRDDYMEEYLGYDPSAFPSTMKSNILGLAYEFKSKNEKWKNQLRGNIFHLNSQITTTEKLTENNTQKIIPPKKGVSNAYYGFSEAITYEIKKGFRVKTSVSKGVRLPTTFELFGDGVNVKSSVGLKPEQSYNATLGILLDKSDFLGVTRLQLDANLYYTFMKDLITVVPAENRLTSLNLGKSEIRGIDADLKIDVTPQWYNYFNITYQQVRDKLKWKDDHNIPNSTYNEFIPNIPRFFCNYGVEFHTEGMLGNKELTRIYLDGSYMGIFDWNFQFSKRPDQRKKWEIPESNILTFGIQQSFYKNRVSLALEVDNLLDREIYMEFKKPLPGRTYKIKLRFNLFRDSFSGGAMGY